ncbi:MAG: hypothetical protein IKA41_05405 [Bacteroidaceae bacterium]|nr:hypothetical protein [Bacteroidaceae bacterium]
MLYLLIDKMNRTLLLFILLLGNSIALLAQRNLSAWIAEIDDAVAVCKMSLPGTHDAATGEGLRTLPMLGVTQALTLGEQWDCGVRAFDLRPAVSGDKLHIYHSLAKTRISFAAAIDTICLRLKQYPSEFAIVLLREEQESESSGERERWPAMVGECIASLGDRAATFSPSLTVGDLRGKILFITRSAYSGTDKGALVRGWSHSPDGTCDAHLQAVGSSLSAPLCVQDFYAPTNSRKQQQKADAVARFINYKPDATRSVWVVNCLSGYTATLLGTPFATSAGYKKNSSMVHPMVLKQLSARAQKQPLGIILMDYAGVDTLKRYNIQGKELVNIIIEQNF